MKKTILAATVGLAIGISSAAQAESYYVFGDVGRSDVDLGLEGVSGVVGDESDTTHSFGVGFRYNENFAVELGYTDLGEATASTTAPIVLSPSATLDGTVGVDASGFFLGVRGDMEVADNVSLFGRTGFFKWDSDASFTGTATLNGTAYTGSGSAEIDDGTDLYLGVGASYSFNDNWSANVQYTRYFLEILGEDADVDTFTAGITYSF